MSSLNMASYIRYSVYRKCPESGWHINIRIIPDHEFVLVVKGAGIVTIEGKEYAVRPGMLFYFYPDLVHSLKSSNDTPMHFYAIHFSFSFLQYANDLWKVEEETSILPLPQAMEMKNYILLAEIMKKINGYWNEKANGFELICNGLFIQLLYYVYEDFKLHNFNYSSGRKVEDAIKYIKENINMKLTIKFIANKVNLSPDYFASIFKNYTGYTLIAYINKCRIDKAKKMLVEENRKVKEVATMMGFADEFYFSRVFKKLEGVSPVQFYEKVKGSGTFSISGTI